MGRQESHDSKFRDPRRSLSSEIAKDKDKSFDYILEMAFNTFGVEKQINEQNEKVNELRQLVRESEEKDKLREDI